MTQHLMLDWLQVSRADAEAVDRTFGRGRGDWMRWYLDEKENAEMPMIVKDSRKEYTPAPEGLHLAVCVDVIDKGFQDTPWGPKQKLQIAWQLEQVNPETGKRFMAFKQYTASLNEKSTLSKDLEAWRGKKFKKEDRDGFDVEKLIGANAQVQIVHNVADNGNVYGNVQAIVPLGKGMTKIAAEDYTRAKDRVADGNGHAATPADEDDDLPF